MKIKIEDEYTIVVKDQRIKLNRTELEQLRNELNRVLGSQHIGWPLGTIQEPTPRPDPFKHGTWIGDDPKQFETWGTNGPTFNQSVPDGVQIVSPPEVCHVTGVEEIPNYHCKPDPPIMGPAYLKKEGSNKTEPFNPDNDGTAIR